MVTSERTSAHAGPPLVWLAVAYTLLFLAALGAMTVLRHGPVSTAIRSMNPYGPGEDAQILFGSSPQAGRVCAFLMLGSTVALSMYVATLVSRMRFLRASSAGTYIAFVGGLGACGALATAALCLRVLSVSDVDASLSVVRALHFVTFLSGGAFFAAAFGLLAGGVSATSYFFRLLPRWLVWWGVVIAVVGGLSTFSLIAMPMTFAIPITRFGGFVWLIATGALMPKTIAEPLSLRPTGRSLLQTAPPSPTP